jgi:hypothetical protein
MRLRQSRPIRLGEVVKANGVKWKAVTIEEAWRNYASNPRSVSRR